MNTNETTLSRDAAVKEIRTARKMAGYAAETAAGVKWAASALIGQVGLRSCRGCSGARGAGLPRWRHGRAREERSQKR